MYNERMTRHREQELDLAKLTAGLEELRRAKAEREARLAADPELRAQVEESQREREAAIAAFACDCSPTVNWCYGIEGGCFSAFGDSLIHRKGCRHHKPWMHDPFDWYPDGYQIRGQLGFGMVVQKFTWGFRMPLCPQCRSELRRKAAEKSAEVRRSNRDERDRDVLMLWDAGKSQRFIAKALECSAGTINSTYKRLQLLEHDAGHAARPMRR